MILLRPFDEHAWLPVVQLPDDDVRFGHCATSAFDASFFGFAVEGFAENTPPARE